MGKMNENIRFSGTVGNVTFYQMWGQTYVRAKSSLTRKRVLKSKVFEKTRQYASKMGSAARIGSFIYKALPADIKERWLYRAITGEAASLLYKGKEEQEVKDLLWKKYIAGTDSKREEAVKATGHNRYHSTTEANKQLREIFLERWEKQGRSYYYFKQAWQKRGYFNKDRFREVLDLMHQPWNQVT
jgi:hypothetical protein